MNDRDEFAKAALIGMLASRDRTVSGRLASVEQQASDAYDAADAMIEERRKRDAFAPISDLGKPTR
jgi:hypothetical protein